MDELQLHIRAFSQTGDVKHLDQAKKVIKEIKAQGITADVLFHSVFEQYASMVRQGADAKKLSQVMNIPSRIYQGWGNLVKKKMGTIRLPTRESVLPAGVKYQASGGKKKAMEIDTVLPVGRGVQDQEGIAWALEVAAYNSEIPDEQLQEMVAQVLEIDGPLALPEDFILIQEEVRFWMEEFINFGPATSTCEYPSSTNARDMVIFGMLKLAKLQSKASAKEYRAPHALMKFSQWKQFMSHYFPLTAMVLFKEIPSGGTNKEEVYESASEMIKRGNYLLITLLERAQILFAGASGQLPLLSQLSQLPDLPLPVMSFLTDEDLQTYQQLTASKEVRKEEEEQFSVVKAIRPQLVGVDPNIPMQCQGNVWNFCRINYTLRVGDIQAALSVPQVPTTEAFVNAFFHLLSAQQVPGALFLNTATIQALRQGKDVITTALEPFKKIYIPVHLQVQNTIRWGLYMINLETKEVRIYDSQSPYTFPHITPAIMAWIKYRNLGDFKQVVVFQEMVEDNVNASGIYTCVFAQLEMEIPKRALDFIQLPSTFLAEFVTEQVLTATVIPIDSFDLQVE